MKALKRIVALLLILLFVAGASVTSFAEDQVTYRVRIYGGAQNNELLFDSDIDTTTDAEKSCFIRGKTVNLDNWISDDAKTYKDKITIDLEKTPTDPPYTKKLDDFYYFKGYRESGKRENVGPQITLEKDMDFVLTYGVRGEQLQYDVKYVATNGTLLGKSGPLYANKGDLVYVAIKEFEGYEPLARALNYGVYIKEDKQIVTLEYRAVSTNNTGSSNTNTGSESNNTGGNNNNNTDNNYENNTGTGNDKLLDVIYDDNVPIEESDDQNGNGDGTSVTEPTAIRKYARILWIVGILLGLLLLALLYWYLLFYRKKKKYENEEDYDFSFLDSYDDNGPDDTK